MKSTLFPFVPARSPWLGLMLVVTSNFALAQSDESKKEPGNELDTVNVVGRSAEGFRATGVEAGTFRGSDVMDVPSTVNVITREVLDQQNAGGLYDAVRNTAGVTRQQNGGETWDQLVIRGIPVENRTNYRLNGSLAIMNFGQAMLEDKERIEVLKGTSALYYGFATPSGIVNYVTKRPTQDDLSSISLNFDQYGTQIGSVDMSRRFGEEREHGLRINAGGGVLGSYLDGASDGNRQFASIAYDWKVSSRLRVTADLEYDHRKTTEQVGVSLPTAVNGVITLPSTVDPKKMVGPDSRFETDALNALVRTDYALNDEWVWTVEAGKARTARDRNLATFSFTSASTVSTGAGRVRVANQHSHVESDLLKSELFGKVDLWGMPHELTLGVSRTNKSQEPIYTTYSSYVSQNLYDPTAISSLTWGATPTTPTTAGLNTRDTGLYAVDRMQLNAQWQLIGGLRNSTYQSNQGTASYDVNRTTPMIAAIWKPVDQWSIYASHAQGVEEGDTAPTGTTNVGERMAPGVSKQYEIGTRWQTGGGSLISLAVFEIDRPGAYTDTSNTYVSDGEIVYKGVELSTQGQLTRQLGWLTSAQWLDPQFVKTSAAYVGKVPENAARQTASAFLSWDAPWASNLTLNTGAYYTGERPVDDLNQAWLPSYTIYTAGGRYVTRMAERKVTWQLNIENLLDKQYWAAGGTRLAAGAPRTIKLGLKIDF